MVLAVMCCLWNFEAHEVGVMLGQLIASVTGQFSISYNKSDMCVYRGPVLPLLSPLIE